MKTDVGNIWSQLKSDPLYFSIILYHRSCSSFDFFGIVIVNVCFLPGADFLLNRALGICKIINYSVENSWQQNPTDLWMESMSGTGPFLSFPAGKSIFGKAIVAPPVVATALGTIRLNMLLKKTERSSCCILLVGANHGALHWFSIQLPVVVDLHCPETD